MMKCIVKQALWLAMIVAPIAVKAEKNYELKDVSGKVQVNVNVGDEGIKYSVSHEGDMMIAESPISMKLTDGTVFGQNPKVKKVHRRSVDEMIYPPVLLIVSSQGLMSLLW